MNRALQNLVFAALLLIAQSAANASSHGINKGSGFMPDKWHGFVSDSSSQHGTDPYKANLNIDAYWTVDDDVWSSYCRLGTTDDINILRMKSTLTFELEDGSVSEFNAHLICFDQHSDNV